MNAFWTGFIIAFLNEAVKYRHYVLQHFIEHRFSWSIFISAPAFFSCGFLSGMAVEFAFKNNVHAPEAIVAVACWALVLVGEATLRSNYFILQECHKENCGESEHVKRFVLVYGLIVTIALLPYAMFSSSYCGIDTIYSTTVVVIVLLVIAVLGAHGFRRFLAYENRYVRSLLGPALRDAFAPNRTEGDDGLEVDLLLRMSREELGLLHANSEASLAVASSYRFGGERRVVAAATLVLSTRKVKQIASEVHAELLEEFSVRLAVIRMLIGTEESCAAAEHQLRLLQNDGVGIVLGQRAKKRDAVELAKAAIDFLPEILARRKELVKKPA